MTWVLMAVAGCAGAPATQTASIEQAPAATPNATLTFHPDLLGQLVTRSFSDGAGPFTIAGPSGWPLVIEANDLTFELQPRAGDGTRDALFGTTHVTMTARVSAPPFFDFGEIPVDLSAAVQFEFRADQEHCMTLYGGLESPVMLDPSGFRGDLGALSQGMLEALVTEQAKEFFERPLWRPEVPQELCPALRPVGFSSTRERIDMLFGANPSNWEPDTPPPPTPEAWSAQIHGSMPERVLRTNSTGTHPWSVHEVRSHIEGERWFIEAKVGPSRNPERWRTFEGTYALRLTETHLSVSQDTLQQTDAKRPPFVPSRKAIRTRVQRFSEGLKWPNPMETSLISSPVRVQIEEILWEAENLTLNGGIFSLNQAPP